MRKIVAVLLATMMVVGMGMMAVFAQTVAYTGSGSTTDGSITIENAAKGETYAIYKLFDATFGASGSPVAYYGTIPADLTTYFEYAGSGTNYVQYTGSGTTMPSAMAAALKTWAQSQTPLASVVSDGDILTFTNLPYGYYVITSTQTGEGAAISVDTTNPHAIIHDKNYTVPSVEKTVEEKSYSIGDTINYTAVFITSNYIGAGSGSKQVINYVISDTLPPFLSDVTIQSIEIKTPGSTADSGTVLEDLGNSTQFDSNKSITLTWAELVSGSYKSKYVNGAVIVIKYSGVLTDVVKFDGNGNKNEITIEPYGSGTGSGSKIPHSGTWSDDEDIWTYGTALHKTDASGSSLAGAEFMIPGLTVVEQSGTPGVYVVQSYDPSGTTGTTMVVNADGRIYILGLASGSYSITETKAPDGYNLLDHPETLTTQVLGHVYTEVSGSWYIDENGNRTEASGTYTTVTSGSYTDLDDLALQIVNNAGTLLPSTGGIGTTIFYIVGGLLAVGAGVVLVAKKRMGKVED